MTGNTVWARFYGLAFLVAEQAFAFLILAFLLKCLILSGYCLLLYGGVRLVKRQWGQKLSVRANYYIWYALLLSFPLSRLGFNTRVKLPFYDLFLGIYYVHLPTLSSETVSALFTITHVLRALLLIATAIWLVAVLVKCIRQIATNIWLQRAIGRQKVFDDQHKLKEQSAAAFGIRAENIQVVAADFIHSPVSYGVFRKTILLPRDYDSRYSPSELYLLLLHEMGHIKNRDTVKLQLLDIAACFIWPVGRMKKHFIRDAEILCDNRVLGIRQGEQTPYGELMIREMSTQQKVRGLGFSDSYHTVKSRLEAIYSRKPERHRIAAFAVAVALLLAGSGAYAAGHPAPWLTDGVDIYSVYPAGFHIIVDFVDDGYIDYDWKDSDDRILSYPADSISQLMGMDPSEFGSRLEEFRVTLANTYRYADDQLAVDKVALYAYLEPYIREGLVVTQVVFVKYTNPRVDTRRNSLLWEGQAGGTERIEALPTRQYALDIGELEQADESNRITTFAVPPVIWAEQVKRFIAHWL